MTPKPAAAPRLEGLDALRGFALFGLFMVHMPELFELYWAHPATDPAQLVWHNTIFTLFAGKAFAMMALCFGVSFFIIMDNSARKGVDFTGRFLWRLAVLLIIGLLHGLWYRGDILEVLALMGVLLVPFYRIRATPLIAVIGVIFLLQPLMWIQMIAGLNGAAWANKPFGYWGGGTPDAYLTGKSLFETVRMNWVDGHPFKWLFMYESGRLSQILGLSLIGLCLGRIGFFSAPERFGRARLIGFVVSLIAALVLWHVRGALSPLIPATEQMTMPRVLWDSIWSSLTDLFIMLCLMFGFLSLYYGPLHRALNAFAAPGRMTLSLYVGQSLVFVPVFYSFGLGLHATMSQSEAVLIGLVAFALQMLGAHLWFKAFHYGPLEWLWRAATYLTFKVPFVKRVQ